MERDRSDAVRRRITETHRKQRRSEVDALRDEVRAIRDEVGGALNRLAVVAVRLRALEEQQSQEETTIRLPILPPKTL